MSIKYAGALGSLFYNKETSYGTRGTNYEFLGRMRTLDMTADPNAETIQADDSRCYKQTIYTQKDCKFSTEMSIFRDSGSYKWSDIVKYTLGANTGATDLLDSFTALMRISSDEWWTVHGCYINELKLASAGVGKQVYATVDVMAKYIPEPDTLANIVSSTFVPPAHPVTPPVTYTKYPTSTIPGLPIIPSSSFDVKISNGMTPKEGFFADPKNPSVTIASTAGAGQVPGAVDIELNLSVMSVGSVYDKLKMQGTSAFDVGLTLDKTLLTFRNCHMTGDDLPSRKQSDYDEPIKIKASDIVITAAV